MGVVIIEGFDHTDYTKAQLKWEYPGSPFNQGQIVDGRDSTLYGGRAIRFFNSGFDVIHYRRPIGLGGDTATFGFDLKPSTSGYVQAVFVGLHFWNTDTLKRNAAIQLKNDGKLYLLDSHNAIIGNTDQIVLNDWSNFECSISGSSWTLKVNGVVHDFGSGADFSFYGTGLNYFNLEWNALSISGIAIDNLWVRDDSTFMGRCRVDTMFPTQDVEVSWDSDGLQTFNYQRVDDNTTNLALQWPPDDDTSYIQTSTNLNAEKYKFQMIPPGYSASAMQVTAYLKKVSGAGLARARVLTKIDSTVYEQADFLTLTSSYQFTYNLWALSPATGIAWTPTEYRNALYGVKAYITGGVAVIRASQVVVERLTQLSGTGVGSRNRAY